MPCNVSVALLTRRLFPKADILKHDCYNIKKFEIKRSNVLFLCFQQCFKLSTICDIIILLLFHTSPIKCGMAYSQFFRRFTERDFSSQPLPVQHLELIGHFRGFPSKLYSFCFGGSNSLRLPLPNEIPFCLGNIGKDLQHQIRYKDTGQPALLGSSIQQRHINHKNVCANRLSDKLPLV